ncbi:MAG: hypothetical protein AB7K68_17310 [Bacteriovoracia bacterium]
MKRILFYFFCLFAALGFFLYGPPRGPDEAQSWWQVGGAFCLFLAFCFSSYTAGRLLNVRILRRPADFLMDFGAGLGLFILAGQLLGLAGLIGYLPSVWMTACLWLPVAIQAFLGDGRNFRPAFSWRAIGLAQALTLITCFLVFLLTWIPDPMPDPLWYNLTAARWWLDAGKIYFPRENIAILATGSWDALYLWSSYLLGGPAGGGLIAGQICGQWMHFVCGGLGSIWALRRFYKFLFPDLSADWIWLVTLVSALSASQQSTIFLAKNDWGATFFLLLALLALSDTKGERGRFFLSGFFAGLAFSAKFTIIFIGLPLLALTFFAGGRKRIWDFLPGIIVGAGPLLLRNFLLLGNPFFPVLGRFFRRADLEEIWRRTGEYDGGLFFSVAGKENLVRLVWQDSPFILLTLLCAVFFWAAPRRFQAQFRVSAIVTAAAAFFLLKVGSQAEYRVFGLGCLLAAGLGLALALSFAQERALFRIGSRARTLLTLGIFALAAYSTSYPWIAPVAVFSQASPPEMIRRHFGGTALAWVRLNVPENKVVASANEFRLYYLSPRKAYRIWDNVDLDQKMRRSRSLLEAVDAMRGAGIDFLLFTRLDWDRYFRKEILDALEATWGRFRETVVFGNENSKVIDLSGLRAALMKHDIPLHPY